MLPILTFHTIDRESGVISVAPQLLQYGLGRLHAEGYRAVPLLDVAICLREHKPFPSRGFVITFDDGYQSVYQEAFPVLRQYQMTATVFLTVGAEGSRTGGRRLPSLEGRLMLSWDEIREMQESGIEFGAHTLTHPKLAGLPAAQAEVEIVKSRDIIQQTLGRPIRSFAYPFGSFDAESRVIVSRLYDCACTDRLAFVTTESDPYLLERIDAYYLRTRRRFDLYLTDWFAPYIRLRAALRKARRMLHR